MGFRLGELASFNQSFKQGLHKVGKLLNAAKVFVEGLKRAGKDLSRERLIAAVEGLNEYETGFSPLITFGPNRRVGAAGAYIVSIEADGNAVSTGWIKSY
ncbi:MAG TPA: hypothetical protein VL866_22925 [Pyrinomonadaceae bacterium]|nr:hypothetical protein [Pyrinomonadaceae bacterium]